ncbi:MAG: 30S ribosomal protein S2 [Candidatus Cloacimonetes bacterium]|nr:30S ribosomal protein S2 [Candidatus Cloacimonadota bacterium]
MSVVSMKQLLEAGVHFGHQTHKWNPKMKKFIFIKRNGIHIIDLKQTVDAINESYMFFKELAEKGEYVLFVGTKKQARDAIEAAAKKCGAFYVNNRWYGGMLTNMTTIRKSIERMVYIEQIQEDGTISNFTKLEATRMQRKHDKIEKGLGGIRGMDRRPGAVFIVDTTNEAIAVNEARKLGIPIVGMVDTNSDPDVIDYVIPSNDDAIRAIHLISGIMANAVVEGAQSAAEGADLKQAEAQKADGDKAPAVGSDDKKVAEPKEKAATETTDKKAAKTQGKPSKEKE